MAKARARPLEQALEAALDSPLREGDDFSGVFAVKPLKRRWTHEIAKTPRQFLKVDRVQLPLAPEKAVSLYSMQGVTAKPGMVAYWHLPKMLPHEIKWLIIYVMLSRVPSLTQLQSVALSNRVRRIIEAGGWYRIEASSAQDPVSEIFNPTPLSNGLELLR